MITSMGIQSTQPIVGSAEPLNREQTLARLRELESWGVDLSLVRDNLRRTPTERIAQMYGVLKLATALQQAVRARTAEPIPPRHD
jgi:hypothetical protein